MYIPYPNSVGRIYDLYGVTDKLTAYISQQRGTLLALFTFNPNIELSA